MLRCNGCGNEMPDNARFCPNCGAAYTPEETKTEDSAVGTEKNICGECGLELPDGAKFCSVCGGKAVKGVSMLKPVASSAPSPAASLSSGMMEAVSPVSAEPSEPAEPIQPVKVEAVPLAQSIPTVQNIQPVVPTVEPIKPAEPVANEPVELPDAAEDAFIPEMGAIPEVGSIPEVSDTFSSGPSTVSVPPVSAGPSVSSTMSATSVGSVPQAAQPVNPVNYGTGVMDTAGNTGVSSAANSTDNAVNAVPVMAGGNMQSGVQSTSAIPAPTVDYSNIKPVKKKKIGARIAIIAGSVVGAAAVAAGVFFFTNKAAFLSTLLGKEKYAVMVESQSITQAAEKIDTEAVVKGVETLSNAFSAMTSISGGSIGSADGSFAGIYDDSAVISASSDVPMMDMISSDGASVGDYGSIDLGAYVSWLNQTYMKSYGTNSVEMKISAEAEAGDSLKSMVGSYVPVDDIVSLINGMELTYDITAGENAFDTTVSAKIDTLNVDCRVVMADNNEMYIVLPFVSDKAMLMKLPKSDSSVSFENAVLSLDKNEVDRVIAEVIEVYLDNYKSASIEMENASVEIAGFTVEGKAITAEFKGEALGKLFSDIAAVIINDDYLAAAYVNYLNQAGFETTVEEYKNSVSESLSFEANSDDKLVITNIIDKNGNVLAKKFAAIGSDSESDFGYTVNGSTTAVEIEYDENVVTILCESTSETDGVIDVSATGEDGQLRFSVKYDGAKTEQFCGQPMSVGTYVLKMEMPDSFEEQLGAGALAAINGATLTFSQSVSGSAASADITFDVANYGSLSLNSEIVVKDSRTPEIPTDVIDLTSMITDSSDGNFDTEALKAYFDEFGEVYDKEILPFFDKYDDIFGEMPEFENPFGNSSRPTDEPLSRETLGEFIVEDVELLAGYAQGLTKEDVALAEKISKLVGEYSALYTKVTAESPDDGQTPDEENPATDDPDEEDPNTEDPEGVVNTKEQELLAQLTEEYWTLYDKFMEIEAEIIAKGEEESLFPMVDIEAIPKMDYTELEIIMTAYDALFKQYSEAYAEEIDADKELKELFDIADYARIDVEHDWEYFYDALKRGSLNINLLNSVRNSLKEYVPAVQNLITALSE